MTRGSEPEFPILQFLGGSPETDSVLWCVVGSACASHPRPTLAASHTILLTSLFPHL